MVHFEGDKSFPLSIEEIASKLSNVEFLVGCLPDVQITEIAPDHATWKVKPKLAFLTSSLNIEMHTTGREAGKSVAYQVVAKAIGASSTVAVTLAFTATENGGTAIHWTGDITQVTGLLKMVPTGLLQGSAHKVIEEVWVAVAARLNPA
jgi:carbon monoxide dehydrogenase subunit G